MQDGKIVVLKETGEKLYHGYIVEELKTLGENVKKALAKNGYMKNAVAKKLMK